jgi:xylan 1,4-beta-xylosidase
MSTPIRACAGPLFVRVLTAAFSVAASLAPAACSEKGGAEPASPACSPGDTCQAQGAICRGPAQRTCQCVGPEGARYVTCDGSDAGGATTGGAASNGGDGTGGVFVRPPDAGASEYASDTGRRCLDDAPWDDSLSADYELVVDAATTLGPWARFYEKVVAADHANTVLSGAWGRNIQNALKKAHDQAGFQTVRFHGLLNHDIGIYSEVDGVPSYDFTRLDQAYDAILLAGMQPFVEISFTPPDLASEAKWLHWYNRRAANISPPKNWDRWQDLMKALVEHWIDRYGIDEVKSWYFEVWNEASWMYTLGTGGYNELYEHTVRGLLAGEPSLRVGGPAESSGASLGSIQSLLKYAENKDLKLDFLSYHCYATDGGAPFGDASRQLAYHEKVMDLTRSKNFAGEVVATEWGPSASTEVLRDTEATASFVVKTIQLLASSDKAPPPVGYGYWAISDIYEEIDTGPALAYREGNYGLFLKGDADVPDSFDVAKPAFNAFRLLHWLGDTRLAVSGGTTGDGVDAIATLTDDPPGLQVLVHHQVTGADADPTLAANVKLSLTSLPFSGPLKLRHYLLDGEHSSSYAAWVAMDKPAKPTPEQWSSLRDAADLCYYDDEVEADDGAVTLTFPQRVHGVSLITLTP